MTSADVVLERFDRSDQGFFGQVWAKGAAGILRLFSGELPWLDNRPNVSCIPPAPHTSPIQRRVVWTWSPRFRRFMYLVLDTEPRGGVRAHPANLMGNPTIGLKAQLNGCIALGERLGWMEGQKALLLSAPAVRRFEAHMGHAPFTLEIRE